MSFGMCSFVVVEIVGVPELANSSGLDQKKCTWDRCKRLVIDSGPTIVIV